MPGTQVGSGWTNKAVRQLITERFGANVQQEWGAQALLPIWAGVISGGAKLYIRRDPVDPGALRVGDAGSARQIRAQWAAGGALSQRSEQSVFGRNPGGGRWNPIGQQPGGGQTGARQKAGRESLLGRCIWARGAESRALCHRLAGQRRHDPVVRAALGGVPAKARFSSGRIKRPITPVQRWKSGWRRSPRIEVIAFPKYTPEENPKEAT